MKIKICGMSQPENVDRAEQAGVDMIGFIFFPGSKRYIGDLEPIPSSKAKRVGVFVDASLTEVRNKIDQWNLDILQLHGDETPEYCRELLSTGIALVKAFQVGERFDFAQLEAYRGHVNYFLFDTKGENYGGTGRTFDWSILEGYALDVPFWLSGGIGPEMAAEIKKLEIPGLVAVDLNSRFEDRPGLKNIEKLKIFVDELQN